MDRGRRVKRALGGLLVLVVLLGTSPAGATPAVEVPHSGRLISARAASPTSSVTPDKELLDVSGDGQFVTVDWTNFPAQGGVYMRECVRGATDYKSQCSQGGYYSVCGLSCPGVWTLGVSDKRGDGSGVAQVAIGDLNINQDGTPIDGKTFTCDFEHDCSLFIMGDPFDLSTSVEVPVGFAIPADACPQDGTVLSGSGGSTASRLFLEWARKICTPPASINLNYVLETAPNARRDYADGASQYGVSPQPLDEIDNATLKSAGGSVAYAPVSATGLVFGYRIFDQRTGNQITDLTMTPDMLARIFTGKSFQFNQEPELKKLDPGVAFPPQIKAIGRGDASEETLAMTTWIWHNAQKDWIAGGVGSGIKPNPFSTGPTDLLPSLGQVTLFSGAAQVARIVATGGTDFNSTTTYGLMGYMDSSWAAQYDLPTLKILMPNGETVQATTQTIRAAISHMTTDNDCLLQPDVTTQSTNLWPIPTVTYMLVPHDAKHTDAPPTKDVAGTLKRLIDYGVGDGQKKLPGGYVPLPDDLRTEAKSVANTIMSGPPLKDCTPPQTHSPSPPPSSPSPTSTANGGGYVPPPPPPSSSDPPPSTDDPSPSITVVTVQAEPASFALGRSGASMVLPILLLVGVLAAFAAVLLMYGDRMKTRLAPVTGKVGASVGKLRPSKPDWVRRPTRKGGR